jgi:hypothetical protein
MASVWAVAFREQCRRPDASELARYRSLLKTHAREPLSWQRRLRFLLGRAICGRRPFAPHLDRERWTVECRGQAA